MVTNLIVRNVDPHIARALNEAAAAHGHSAEAEHREILQAALARRPPRSFKDVLASMPDVGRDAGFDVRHP
ncbi:hypothetical protein [Acidiferrobacter sp.]|uniref:FitA-like ribbon-helix-helix domain-containing protein n=1 Tax=Acidiferrobacter sp. TaxID=1872107 RepID=UPI00261E00CE|nr:hypothetical protein [Acidiferrobacter sp.]